MPCRGAHARLEAPHLQAVPRFVKVSDPADDNRAKENRSSCGTTVEALDKALHVREGEGDGKIGLVWPRVDKLRAGCFRYESAYSRSCSYKLSLCANEAIFSCAIPEHTGEVYARVKSRRPRGGDGL
jgi:hypothetical protein